ncbi:hypothetical protein SUH3_16035 [Pseudosulfitobacter pseudonitzschiae]|uniref:Uncharacterized protein n=1 Tax=Pseudosulfitobacter pseudonitzschiae TaxID=1402135 RepID=A0A073ITR0_9RHOB|nr:hypothetical protein SUH3_16035 [Pseudosulfitobacter pseudonitzschiae]
MDGPVARGRCLLQGCHHHVDETRVPIRGLPKHGVEQGGDTQHCDVLDPDEQEHRSEEPDHRVHDGQAQKLGRAHEAEEERRALSHRQRPRQRWWGRRQHQRCPRGPRAPVADQ